MDVELETMHEENAGAYAGLVAAWLGRVGVRAEITRRPDRPVAPASAARPCFNERQYDVVLTHPGTAATCRLAGLVAPERHPGHDEVLYHAMAWIVDTLNSADQPDYAGFRAAFGFEDGAFARAYWRVATEGRAFFDARSRCARRRGAGMHQEVHCLTALAGGVDEGTLDDALRFLKGEGQAGR